MSRSRLILAGVIGVMSTSMAHAQQPITKANSVTATATIQAIDSTTRRVTLRNEKGEEDTFSVGPLVTRFDQFKVGDKIKMTYYESLVFQVRKPGEKSNPQTDEAALARAKGTLPGGTAAVQSKRTVTVKAIDMALPSITVATDDGRTVTRKIEDKKNLSGVAVGDKIDITYTEALLTSLEKSN
jgi:Cu/Ag efflux protein CusF